MLHRLGLCIKAEEEASIPLTQGKGPHLGAPSEYPSQSSKTLQGGSIMTHVLQMGNSRPDLHSMVRKPGWGWGWPAVSRCGTPEGGFYVPCHLLS